MFINKRIINETFEKFENKNFLIEIEILNLNYNLKQTNQFDKLTD